MNDSHYKGMPKAVRIGCFTYEIHLMRADDADLAGVHGAHNGDALVIKIAPNNKPQQLANTFIHEVMHGIHKVYGVDTGDSEEAFTTQTANGLCAFWQDNPQTMKWWKNLLAVSK